MPSLALLVPWPSAEGLEGFTPPEGAEEAAAGEPPAPSGRPAGEGWPSTRNTVVAEYPGAGPLQPPSPWALAGLLPVGVLLGSSAYSTWLRRRPAPPL